MKYAGLLGFFLLILVSASVFAASPVITGPTTATREYIGTDYNYYDFNVIWRSGVVTDADLDFDITSCMMSNNGGYTFYSDTPTVDWNADTNQCQTTLDYEWGVTDLAQIIFRVSDEADNNTNSPDMNWYLDNTPPTSAAIFDGVNKITITAIDDATTTGVGVGVKRIYYRLNTGTWTYATGASVEVTTTTPGDYTMYFYSMDNFDNNESRDGLSGEVWSKPFSVAGFSPTGNVCAMTSLLIFVLVAVALITFVYAGFSITNGGISTESIIALGVSAITILVIVMIMGFVNALTCVV